MDAPRVSAPTGKELHTIEWNDRTYAECLRLADQGWFEGRRILVDASFHKESWRQRFLQAARESGVTGCLLVCQAEPAVIRDRLARRRDDLSDADGFVYEDMARRWEEPRPATRKFIHEIASGGTLDDSLAQALAVLQEIGLWNRDG